MSLQGWPGTKHEDEIPVLACREGLELSMRNWYQYEPARMVPV